jgi:DNA-binding MarR family transcriptional regulator
VFRNQLADACIKQAKGVGVAPPTDHAGHTGQTGHGTGQTGHGTGQTGHGTGQTDHDNHTDAIARELVTLVRSTKELHAVALPGQGPVLERPAFILLVRIAEQGPLRPSAVADALCVDLSTVSRQLAALESAGWLVRERDPEDRRAHLVRVTPEGRLVLDHNCRARREALGGLLAGWSDEDRAAFHAQLARFNDAVRTRRLGAGTRQEIR